MPVVVGATRVASHVGADPVLAPTRLTTAPSHVAVLDAAHRRLAWWDPRLPHAAPRHVGPALGRAPTQVVAHRDGFGVLDPRDARLTLVDHDGRVRRRIGLAHLPQPLAACPFDDGGWLVLTADDSLPLVRVDSTGAPRWRRALPWAAVRGWPALARQGVLVPAAHGCVVALAFGPGWAMVEPDGRLPTVMPLRETSTGLAPRGRWGRTQARAPLVADATVHGDTLELLVAGTTAEAWRLLDRYHLRTGAYLGAVRLPGPVRAVSAVPDGWVAIVPTPRGARLAHLAIASPSVGNPPGIR